MKIWTLFLVFGLAGVPMLGSDVYSYVDESGIKVITNLGASRQNVEVPLSTVTPVRRGSNYLPLIKRLAGDYGVDAQLVEAIIKVESNFNPRAVSVKNCQGLMQLHPDTARRYGVTDTFDPEQNIEGGIRYLRFLIEEFDSDLDNVLAAYNAGENAVRRYDGVPPYSETRNYVKKVRSLFKADLTKPRETVPQPRRVYRVVQDDGHVLFTNTPVSLSNR